VMASLSTSTPSQSKRMASKFMVGIIKPWLQGTLKLLN
jgi:hypothetical protein